MQNLTEQIINKHQLTTIFAVKSPDFFRNYATKAQCFSVKTAYFINFLVDLFIK